MAKANQRIVILTDPTHQIATAIKWESIGTVVTELSELYQTVKERQIELVLVEESRQDLTPAVAIRLRKFSPSAEIWRVVHTHFGPDDQERLFDGYLSRDLGEKGLSERIATILADKELLKRYQMIGRSPKLKTVARTIEKIAPTDVPVMIVGPSGSGKELVARAIHADSNRHNRPYVAINCGALAEGVLESELFGHERGAFTGSVAKREGLFHKAQGGTIFLDEIGETKPDTQVKLLRVLEDGTYYPVGSSDARRADVRVVAATNRDLTEAISERQFRDDLYFRISVVKIVLPPLLDRRQDIQPLLHYFWAQSGVEYSDAALDLLMRYDWPGNVRQLRNFATRMAALKPAGVVDVKDVERFLEEQNSGATHLPVSTGRTVEQAGQELIYRAILSLGAEVKLLRDLITSHLPNELEPATTVPGGVVSNDTMDEMEKRLIEKTLAETEGNRKETARRLGIAERTLYRKLRRFDLS
jgi:DNA-binding NtrC family response regulator